MSEKSEENFVVDLERFLPASGSSSLILMVAALLSLIIILFFLSLSLYSSASFLSKRPDLSRSENSIDLSFERFTLDQ